MKKPQILFFLALLYGFCIYGSMAMMSLGAGIVFLGWICLRWGSLKKDLCLFKDSPLLLPTLFLCFSCVWSLLWVQLIDLEFLGKKPQVQWFQDTRKLWHLFFPFILASVFSSFSESQLQKIFKAWLAFGLGSAVLGIVQHYIPVFNPTPMPNPGLRDYYHSTGLSGFHLSYATILSFPALAWLSLFGFFQRRSGFNRYFFVFLLVCMVFFIANIFTYSKIAWLALPASIALVLLMGFKGRVRYVLTGLTLIFCVFWSFSPQVKQRFFNVQTIEERFKVWEANFEMIKRYPLFGVGWHHNSELSSAYYEVIKKRPGFVSGFVSHAHNNFLDQWASTGIIGLFSFVYWCVICFVLNYRIYTSQQNYFWRSMGLGFVGGWVCLHINGLTQTNFWDAKILHQTGFVVAMTLEIYRRKLELLQPKGHFFGNSP